VETKNKNITKIIADSGKQEIFITREFDAPREFVFKAFTDPDFMVQWLGPRDQKMKIEKFEPASGGSYRYIHTDPDGNEFGFHGVVHEVLPPLRIIQTFEYEGLPESGHVAMETSLFEDLPDARTKLTTQSVFQTVTDRDSMLLSGMEKGVNESHERLDELIEKMGK